MEASDFFFFFLNEASTVKPWKLTWKFDKVLGNKEMINQTAELHILGEKTLSQKSWCLSMILMNGMKLKICQSLKTTNTYIPRKIVLIVIREKWNTLVNHIEDG